MGIRLRNKTIVIKIDKYLKSLGIYADLPNYPDYITSYIT